MDHAYLEDGGEPNDSEYTRYTKRFRRGEHEPPTPRPETRAAAAMAAAMAAVEKGVAAAARGDRAGHAAAEKEFRSAHWFSDESDHCLILEAIGAGFIDAAAFLISIYDIDEWDRNEATTDLVECAISIEDPGMLHAVLTALEEVWGDNSAMMHCLETAHSPANNCIVMEYAIGWHKNPAMLRVLFEHGHGHWPLEEAEAAMWFEGMSWFQYAGEFGTPGILEVLIDRAHKQGEFEVITFGSSACTSCMLLADSVPRWQVELNAPAKMYAHWPAGPPPKDPERVLAWVEASYPEKWVALRRDATRFAERLRRAMAEGTI